MRNGDLEMQAYLLFEKAIDRICQGRWKFLEWDDRISEACFVFIVALRRYPTNSGHFWKDYELMLTEYMGKLKMLYGNQKCWLSLDAPLHSQYEDGRKYTWLDVIQAEELDSSEEMVGAFMATLPEERCRILNVLFDNIGDRSSRAVCAKVGMTKQELKQYRSEIAEDYAWFRRSGENGKKLGIG